MTKRKEYNMTIRRLASVADDPSLSFAAVQRQAATNKRYVREKEAALPGSLTTFIR